jgi:hypothetical protein
VQARGGFFDRQGGFLAQAQGNLHLARVALWPRGEVGFLPTEPTQLLADDALGFGLRYLQPQLPKMVLPDLAIQFFEFLLFE